MLPSLKKERLEQCSKPFAFGRRSQTNVAA
jgi:hypothetical protein